MSELQQRSAVVLIEEGHVALTPTWLPLAVLTAHDVRPQQLAAALAGPGDDAPSRPLIIRE